MAKYQGGKLAMGFNVIGELLRSDGSLVVNKKLIHAIGLYETIIYQELLSKYYYYKQNNQLNEEGLFYSTIEDLEKDTSLSGYQQRKPIEKLEELGLIECTYKGTVPRMRHFKIIENYELLRDLLSGEETAPLENQPSPSGEETAPLVVKKLHLNNTNNNTNTLSISKDIDNREILTKNEPVLEKTTMQDSLVKNKKKKSNKAKKNEKINTMLGMINTFTSNEEVKAALSDYFNIRIKRGLEPIQWKIILDDLRNDVGDNAALAITKIKAAIGGGWLKIVYESSNRGRKNSFDNTAGRKVEAVVNMSAAERKEYERNMARDGSGNLIQF